MMYVGMQTTPSQHPSLTASLPPSLPPLTEKRSDDLDSLTCRCTLEFGTIGILVVANDSIDLVRSSRCGGELNGISIRGDSLRTKTGGGGPSSRYQIRGFF